MYWTYLRERKNNCENMKNSFYHQANEEKLHWRMIAKTAGVI